jgi:hypothetical protein
MESFSQQINSLCDPIDIDKITNLFNQIDSAQCYEHILLMLTLHPVETNMIYENSSIDYNIKKWDGLFRTDDICPKEIMSKVNDIIGSTKHKNGKLSILIKQIIDRSIENVERPVLCNFISDVGTNEETKYPAVRSFTHVNVTALSGERLFGATSEQSATKIEDIPQSSEETSDDEPARLFKHIDADGKSYGRFLGTTAKQAASKAFTKLVMQKKNAGVEIESDTPIIMQGNNNQIHGYVGSRIKFSVDDTKYYYRNQIKKISPQNELD